MQMDIKTVDRWLKDLARPGEKKRPLDSF